MTEGNEEQPVRVQHKLRNQWALWYLNDDRNTDWEQRLKCVCKVKTVEEFWALQNNIRPPSSLSHSCDYNFFKGDIQPMWEVPENNIEKSKPPAIMDQIWLEIILSMIGEQYGEDMDSICGLVCNVRNKGSKISMWTRDHNDDAANLRIGKIIAQTLLTANVPEALKPHLPLFDSLRYEDHASCMKKSGSTVKPKLTISAEGFGSAI